MAQESRPIIIRRIKKVVATHHGGAWKIAYADFVTAMMAFFLLMWLLGSTAKGDLNGIADYFRTPLKVALQGGSGAGDSSSVVRSGGQDMTRSAGQVKRGESPPERSNINLQAARAEVAREEATRMTKLKERIPVSSSADAARLTTRLGTALAELDSGTERVIKARAEIGAHLGELDGLASANEVEQGLLAARRSRLEDVDYAKAMSDFARQQMALEAAQRSYARVARARARGGDRADTRRPADEDAQPAGPRRRVGVGVRARRASGLTAVSGRSRSGQFQAVE